MATAQFGRRRKCYPGADSKKTQAQKKRLYTHFEMRNVSPACASDVRL
jgi:hypothetical protein